MNKTRLYAGGIAGILLLSLAAGGNALAADGEKDVSASDGNVYAYAVSAEESGHSADAQDYTFDFSDEITVDGVTYVFNHTEYSVVNEYEDTYGDEEIAYKVTRNDAAVPADEKEDYEPSAKKLTENGFTYTYTESTFTKNSDSKEATDLKETVDSEVTTGDISSVSVPETVEYEYEGETYELAYTGYDTINEGWHSGYTYTGTVTGYDAGTITVGNVSVEPDSLVGMTREQLIAYAASFGYTSDTYRPETIRYTSEPYTDASGKVCRDFAIDMSVYTRQFRLSYELSVDNTVYTAKNTYELSDSDQEELETMKSTYHATATAYYDVKPAAKHGLSTPAKVAIAFGIIVGIALILALVIYILRGGRSNTDRKSRRDIRRDYKNL